MFLRVSSVKNTRIVKRFAYGIPSCDYRNLMVQVYKYVLFRMSPKRNHTQNQPYSFSPDFSLVIYDP